MRVTRKSVGSLAGLTDLPVELVSYIVSHLDDEDIFAIRLTNKYLQASTLSYFGRRFFRKKGYLIWTPSIDVFKAVAEHEGLRKFVQHVWFNPDFYTFANPVLSSAEEIQDLKDKGLPRYGVAVFTKSQTEKYAACVEAVNDNSHLQAPAKLAAELTAAFRNLPNLATVGMRRGQNYRPWGWNTLALTTGRDPRRLGSKPYMSRKELSGPTQLFIAIIHSVANADVSLKRLYTDTIEIDHILLPDLPQKKLDAACRDLLYLEVNITKGWLNEDTAIGYKACDEESEYGEQLCRFFQAASNIRELGFQDVLDYGTSGKQHDVQSWKQMYRYLAFQKLAHGVELHRLTRLKLESIVTSPNTLKAFISPPRNSLISLKLRRTRLLSSKGSEVAWRHIFELLRDEFSQLSFLLLHHLTYDSATLSFAEQPFYHSAARGRNGTPNLPYITPPRDSVTGKSLQRRDQTTVQANGRDAVVAKVTEIVDRHWYQLPLSGVGMDEALWHTDTSDEEW